MNLNRYQILKQQYEASKSEAFNSALTSGALLLGAVGLSDLAPPLRILMSFGSLAFALGAKESKAATDILRTKVRRAGLKLDELEHTEESLEFANQKFALEESYGIHPVEEPRSATPPQTPALQEPRQDPLDFIFKDPWDASDDYGLTAMAPDAKAEIRGWLTDSWVKSNKVICAASGAGKSTYLKWEYQTSKDQQLTVLIDPHLLSNHLEGRYWTGSKESDLRVVNHEPFQISQTLNYWVTEVKERLRGNRELTPAHLIIDEADGSVFKDESIQPLFTELVCLISNEARKTKVTITFVVHSIQKQKTGLDASDLVQIAWMVMGNSLDTPYSRWPGGLNPKAWRSKQSMLQDSLDPGQARALVIYEKGVTRLEILEVEALCK